MTHPQLITLPNPATPCLAHGGNGPLHQTLLGMLHQSTFPWASLVTGGQECQETPGKTNVLMMKRMTLSISSIWKFPPASWKLSLVLNSQGIQRHENYTRMEQKEINVFHCYHKTMWQMTGTGLPMEFPMWSLGPVQKNPKTWPPSFGPHHHFIHGNPRARCNADTKGSDMKSGPGGHTCWSIVAFAILRMLPLLWMILLKDSKRSLKQKVRKVWGGGLDDWALSSR